MLAAPLTSFALSLPASWTTGSSAAYIIPSAFNKVIPYVQAPFFIGSTSTSTFAGGVVSPCFSFTLGGACLTSSGATPPGGGNRQLQYNNNGSLAGTSSPVVGFITATSTTATSTFINTSAENLFVNNDSPQNLGSGFVGNFQVGKWGGATINATANINGGISSGNPALILTSGDFGLTKVLSITDLFLTDVFSFDNIGGMAVNGSYGTAGQLLSSGGSTGADTWISSSSLGISGANYLSNSGANTFLNTGNNLQAPTFQATSTTATSTLNNASSTSFFAQVLNSGNIFTSGAFTGAGTGLTGTANSLNIGGAAGSLSSNGISQSYVGGFWQITGSGLIPFGDNDEILGSSGGLNFSQANVYDYFSPNLVNGNCVKYTTASGLTDAGAACGSGASFSTNPFQATIFNATSTTATSTLPNLTVQNLVVASSTILNGTTTATILNLCDTQSNMNSVVLGLGQIGCTTDTKNTYIGSGTTTVSNLSVLNPIFHINGNGLYGIGTKSPLFNLDFGSTSSVTIGNSQSGAFFTAQSNGDQGLCVGTVSFGCSSTGGDVDLVNGEGGSGILSSGNSYINTGGNGDITLTSGNSTNIILQADAGDVYIGDEKLLGNHTYLDVSDNAQQFIFNNGFVGIGQISPATALDVVGDITYEDVKNAHCLATNSLGVIIASTTCASTGSGGVNFLSNSGANTFLNTGSNLQFPTFAATSTTGTSTVLNALAVGTTTAVAGQALTVAGGANFGNSNAAVSFDIDPITGNVGIATTTPFASLTSAGSAFFAGIFTAASTTGTSTFAGNVAVGAGTTTFTVDSNGHQWSGGSTPVCTTGCTMQGGDDNDMRIITGSSISTVVITFANTWVNPVTGVLVSPLCIASDESGVTTGVEASSTATTVTLSLPTALTTKNIALQCRGSVNLTF